MTLIFTILMILVFGKLAGFAFRTAWGLTKIIVNLILLPLVLIGFVVAGLMYIAVPLLLIVGVIALFQTRR